MKALKVVKRPITTTLAAIVVIGIAYVIGAFLTGPGSVRAGGGHIPTAVLDMPCGILTGTDTNGTRSPSW